MRAWALICGWSLVASSALPAAAQDANSAPIFRSGSTIGASIGRGWGSAKTSVTTSSSSRLLEYGRGDYDAGDLSSPTLDVTTRTSASYASRAGLSGWVPGIHVGYNWVSGAWLLGFETDLQIANQTGSSTFCAPLACGPGATFGNTRVDLDWFGTARGRAGFLLNPSLLVYATAGMAYGRFEFASTAGVVGGPNVTAHTSGQRVGYVFGGGLEQMIGRNWSVRAEYLRLEFGSIGGTSGPVNTRSITMDSDTVRLHDQSIGVSAQTHSDRAAAAPRSHLHFQLTARARASAACCVTV